MTESNKGSAQSASGATHEQLRAKIDRLEDALSARLGLGGNDTAFGSVDATTLALERTLLAAERTLQAWIRTALSLISFGFTIGKLGQVVFTMPGMPRHIGTDSLGYLLVTLGTLSLAVAAVQHWFTMRKLRARGLPRELSLAFGVAILLVLLGAFAFSALVMKL
jgi:putative membrane protein